MDGEISSVFEVNNQPTGGRSAKIVKTGGREKKAENEVKKN